MPAPTAAFTRRRAFALALVLAAVTAPCLAQAPEPAAARTTQSPEQAPQEAAQNPLIEEIQPPPTAAQPARGSTPDAGDRLPFMPAETEAGGEAPGAAGLVVRALGALMLIVGLIVAAGFGLRKFGAGGPGAFKDSNKLAVLSSVALGDRRSLSVVSFNGRTLLVGSTPHSFTLLASDAADEDDPAAPAPAGEPARVSVAELLRERAFDEELEAALGGSPRSATGKDAGGAS